MLFHLGVFSSKTERHQRVPRVPPAENPKSSIELTIISDNIESITQCKELLASKLEEAYDKLNLTDCKDTVKSLTSEEVSPKSWVCNE